MPFFVQFPHPKDEPSQSRFVRQQSIPSGDSHRRDGEADRLIMPWNARNKHCRKFMLSSGRYTSDGNGVRAGDLVLWAEWEAPSEIVTTWPPENQLPRTLHRPFWFAAPDTMIRQNTDPWIWGDQFLYSNCKQAQLGSLRQLTRGSVLCFGSTFGGDFCADTIMVVASAEPWTPVDCDDLDVSQAFKICTARSLALGDPACRAGAELVLYRGATIDDPVEGMYSFVPSLPDTVPHPRFARPPVTVPGLINSASTQSPRGSSTCLPHETIRHAWQSLRDQVLDSGLVLATHLDTPLIAEESPQAETGTRPLRC